ncbi:MAG: T9SS type A sorting domain-containing protein [bacterium]|nr:T9SS type A sorting domain-containing protein [bacterium]
MFLLITAWASLAHAVIHFVPDDFLNLQEAIDESNSNDTIVCRNGTYYGPFFIWARNVTISSEFVIDQDPGHILNCVIRPQRGDRDHRCLMTEEGDSAEHDLRLVGLTLALGRAVTVDEFYGGGIYLQNRTAVFQDCIFKSCVADMGGAIYSDRSNLTLNRCTFPGNDAIDRGRVLYARLSRVVFNDCDIGPNGHLYEGPMSGDAEIQMDGCGIEIRTSSIHDIGWVDDHRELFRNVDGASAQYLRLYGCTIESCNLSMLITGGATGPREFSMDSCIVRNNQNWFGFFKGYLVGPMQTAQITRNWFEENYHYMFAENQGLLYLDGVSPRYVVEENYFSRNTGTNYACIGLARANDPLIGRVQRNYFAQNYSRGLRIGDSTTNAIAQIGEGVFEYNGLVGNLGLSVYTSTFLSPTSYALHNYWGDSTGPYEATRNPGGLGDTTNAATIYDEWLLSRDEIPDTSLFPDAVENSPLPVSSTWQLGTIYPNAFNSEFRVVLDGMTGADFEVKLYDLLGREVALLHSGRTLRGTLNFAAPASLAAGIYFISAHDRFYSETKKILYLK